MTNEAIEVVFSKFGVANRIGNKVVVNENLKKYPYLMEKVIEHELRHSSHGVMNNVRLDFNDLVGLRWKEFFERMKFMLKHPLSFLQASPVWFYKGRPYFDMSLILVYGMMFIALIVLFFVSNLLRTG